MRPLAVMIRRPTGSRIGGGADAGRLLSRYIADLIPIDCAEMSDHDASEPWQGNTFFYRRGYSGVSERLRHWLPPLRMREANAFMFSTIPKLIERDEYNVVHIHNLHPIWAVFQVARACQRHGKPYVLACHGIHEMADIAGMNNYVGVKRIAAYVGVRLPLRYVARHAALVYASSPADFPILDSLGVKRERVRVVPNGVKPELFTTLSEDRLAEIRDKYKLPSNQPILLSVGHVRAYKGYDVLLRALNSVREPWHSVIVGPHTFPKVVQELRALLGSLGLDDKVTLTGQVPLEDMPGFFQIADLFVFPSRRDTFPLAILEAMAKSKPIIATKIGGIPFQIGDGAGVLVDAGDIVGMANAINTLLDDPAARVAYAKIASARLQEKFTWEHAARLAVEGYRELV